MYIVMEICMHSILYLLAWTHHALKSVMFNDAENHSTSKMFQFYDMNQEWKKTSRKFQLFSLKNFSISSSVSHCVLMVHTHFCNM